MAGRIALASLGCAKALVDSEHLIARLFALGYQLVPNYEEADLAIVNTCGFIDPAIQESLDEIGLALEATPKVVATGCLGARPEVIQKAHPEVLAVTGPAQFEAVIEAVTKALPPDRDPRTALIPPRVRLTPRHYAYLKIAEGCDNRCSFCIIPKLRGPQVSRPLPELAREAEALVKTGAEELILIAQDTLAYGRDRGEGGLLLRLLDELAPLGAWVRLLYTYPYPEVEQVVQKMAEGKLLPYLDVPLQHASPKILKLMRRPGDAERYLERIKSWRKTVPELTIRSVFIVGFPGETEEDFELLLDFLNEAELDRVGAFTYSEVEGAAANALPGRVPEEVKEERYHRLMQLQAEISARRMRRWLEKEIPVIVDEPAEEPGLWIARGPGDAPGVDGVVFLEGEGLEVGRRYRARVTGADTYDLFARALGPLAKPGEAGAE